MEEEVEPRSKKEELFREKLIEVAHRCPTTFWDLQDEGLATKMNVKVVVAKTQVAEFLGTVMLLFSR